MATVNGSVLIRAGSEDPVTLQLLDDDGATPIDLTGISLLTLHLKNIATGTVTTITGGKLVVLDAATGKIKLSQAAADFAAAARYEYWVSFKDGPNKMLYVPEDKNYTWIVRT